MENLYVATPTQPTPDPLKGIDIVSASTLRTQSCVQNWPLILTSDVNLDKYVLSKPPQTFYMHSAGLFRISFSSCH